MTGLDRLRFAVGLLGAEWEKARNLKGPVRIAVRGLGARDLQGNGRLQYLWEAATPGALRYTGRCAGYSRAGLDHCLCSPA